MMIVRERGADPNPRSGVLIDERFAAAELLLAGALCDIDVMDNKVHWGPNAQVCVNAGSPQTQTKKKVARGRCLEVDGNSYNY